MTWLRNHIRKSPLVSLRQYSRGSRVAHYDVLASLGAGAMGEVYRTGERNEWMTVRPDDPAGILDIMPVHVTPDGKTYAYGYRRQLSDLYIVTGLT